LTGIQHELRDKARNNRPMLRIMAMASSRVSFHP
jgi:hypothetical protein